jgi:flagellar protein FlaG
MVGNSISVTVAPTRTSVSSIAEPVAAAAAPAIASTGKDASRGGEVLPAETKSPPPADVADTVRALNELMAERQRDLSFHIDETSGRTVITVLDTATARVVRQIPAEEVLAVARAIRATGALVDEHG